MSDRGHVVALGPCGLCKISFQFDPDTVPNMTLDPVTKLPPDVGGDPQRARVEPICDNCVDQIEAERKRLGLPVAWPRHNRGAAR